MTTPYWIFTVLGMHECRKPSSCILTYVFFTDNWHWQCGNEYHVWKRKSIHWHGLELLLLSSPFWVCSQLSCSFRDVSCQKNAVWVNQCFFSIGLKRHISRFQVLVYKVVSRACAQYSIVLFQTFFHCTFLIFGLMQSLITKFFDFMYCWWKLNSWFFDFMYCWWKLHS